MSRRVKICLEDLLKINDEGDPIILGNDGIDLGYRLAKFGTEEEVLLACDVLFKLERQYSWSTHMLPPFKVAGREDYFLAFRCGTSDIKHLSSPLPTWWRFESVDIHLRKATKKVRMFFTRNFLNLIYSIFRTVVAFVDEDLRPCLEKRHMYFSMDDGIVVFTSFTRRDRSVQHSAYEAQALIRFFEDLMSKVKKDNVAMKEFQEFLLWLDGQDFSALKRDREITKVFENVIFWNPPIRLNYIFELQDHEEGGGVFPMNLIGDAFKGQNPQHDWYDMMEMRNSDIQDLDRFLEVGVSWHLKQTKGGSSTNTNSSSSRFVNPEDQLKQGLYHVRQFLGHFYKTLSKAVSLL